MDGHIARVADVVDGAGLKAITLVGECQCELYPPESCVSAVWCGKIKSLQVTSPAVPLEIQPILGIAAQFDPPISAPKVPDNTDPGMKLIQITRMVNCNVMIPRCEGRDEPPL
ncbi:hypothetical protein FKM82_024610 [Ascaphus truei]